MFNSVQFVRDICQKRKIPISQLEKDCGFSNGYLNPKKMTKLPFDRAQIIADYLGISATVILTGEEKAPAESGKRSDKIANQNIIRIAGRDGSYSEKVLTDKQLELVKALIDQLPEVTDL